MGCVLMLKEKLIGVEQGPADILKAIGRRLSGCHMGDGGGLFGIVRKAADSGEIQLLDQLFD